MTVIGVRHQRPSRCTRLRRFVAFLSTVLSAQDLSAENVTSENVGIAAPDQSLVPAIAPTTFFLPPPSQLNLPVPYVQPTEAERLRYYAWNALGPTACAGASIAAAIDQSFNFPSAWGQGADAYGRRVASNLGISLVTASVQYSLGEAFHEDTTYYRCSCTGFLARFLHAAVERYVAPWPRRAQSVLACSDDCPFRRSLHGGKHVDSHAERPPSWAPHGRAQPAGPVRSGRGP